MSLSFVGDRERCGAYCRSWYGCEACSGWTTESKSYLQQTAEVYLATMDMMFVLPWKASLFGHGNEIEMHKCLKRMLNQTTQIMRTFSGYRPFQATNRQRIHKETVRDMEFKHLSFSLQKGF